MKKPAWDRYAPIGRQTMRGDARAQRFRSGRISQTTRDKDVLELATGPGLLAKHIASVARWG